MGQTQDLWDRCLELFNQGRIDEADRLASESVRAFPDDGLHWQMHGLLRQRVGDFAGACEALETASLLVPLEPAAQCALADCHAKAGRIELAQDLYRALAESGRCPTALLPSVSSGLNNVGDSRTALEVCRELIRRDPSRHEAYFGVAYAMRKLGHSSESILPTMLRAHELAPESPVYRIVLASLLAQVGHHDEAYDLLRDVRPDSVRCPCCVRRIMAIFQRAGDAQRLAAFEGSDDPCPDAGDA